jgi:hypothetical protein
MAFQLDLWSSLFDLNNNDVVCICIMCGLRRNDRDIESG